MNIDKREIRGRHSGRKKTAVLNKAFKYGEENIAEKVLKNHIDQIRREKDTSENQSKEIMDNNSRKSRREESIHNSKDNKTNDEPPVTEDDVSPVKEDDVPPVTEDDVPPVIDDLFRKLKKDRQKAGIPLVFEEDKNNSKIMSASRQDQDTFSKTEARDLNIKQESYGHKSDHRPSTPSTIRSTPSTPSSFCLSPWDELTNDTDNGNRKTSTRNSSRFSPEGSESIGTDSVVYRDIRDFDLPIACNSSNNELQLYENLDDNDWPNDKTLAECNMYMLTNNINTDVTMLVGKKQEVISAHSFILTNRSPEFARLLNSSSFKKNKLLTLNKIRQDVMEQILRYIYTDDADLTHELALAIIPATGHLGPKALRTKCFRYLLSELTSDTACTILEYALIFEEFEIYDKCLHFIHVNAKEVFNSDNFGDLSPKCIDDITKSDDLNSDEYSVFDALIMWADKQCIQKQLSQDDSSRRDLLGMMIFNVRFVTLDIDGFTAHISHRDILKPEERMEIFRIFHDKTGDLPEHLTIHPRRKYNIKYHLQKEFIEENENGGSAVVRSRESSRLHSVGSAKEHLLCSNKTISGIADADLPIRRVVRFQSFGNSWEMAGVDCIAFRVSTPIVFRGVQIFGPEKDTSPYIVDIKLYDDIKNVVREDKVLVEPCRGNIINDVVLREPTRIPSNRFFTIQLRILSKPTKEGAEGVKVLDAGGVIFEFRNGENCSPRTNVNKGQMPSIIYSKISQ